jgi:hypothetical protein
MGILNFYPIDNQLYTPLGAGVFPLRVQGEKQLIIILGAFSEFTFN